MAVEEDEVRQELQSMLNKTRRLMQTKDRKISTQKVYFRILALFTYHNRNYFLLNCLNLQPLLIFSVDDNDKHINHI